MRKVLFIFMAVSLLMVSCDKKRVEEEVTLTSLVGTKWAGKIEIVDKNTYTMNWLISFTDNKSLKIDTEFTASHMPGVVQKKTLTGSYTYDALKQTGSLTFTDDKETLTNSFTIRAKEKELVVKDIEVGAGKQDFAFKQVENK